MFKVRGELNPADLLTKALGRAVLDGHLDRLCVHREKGRAVSAPAASAEVDTALAARRHWADMAENEGDDHWG